MTKRQCLTCGFFQPSGSDSMGWCNNPRRKIASDIRLYVRSHELPCRDSWDHDLWEDKASFAAPDDVVLSNDVAPVAPASIDDLVFLASAQRATNSGDFETASPTGPAPESSVDQVIREESAGAAIVNARANTARVTVRRAHQQLLAGKRIERFADGASSAMDGGFSAPVASLAAARDVKPADRFYEADKPVVDYTATRPAFNAVPPVQPTEMDRSIPKMAIYPGEEDRFSSVPRPVDGVQLPKRAPRERASIIRSTSLDADLDTGVATPPRSAHDRTETVVPADTLDYEKSDVLPNAASFVNDGAGAHDVILAAEPEVVHVDDDRLMGQDFAHVSRPRLRAGGLFRPRRRQQVEPIYESGLEADDVERGDDPRAEERTIAPVFDLQAPVRPEAKLSVQALADEVVDEPELDDMEFGSGTARCTALWADVPRMCRTCRDFRPAESGDRGWCNNKWAFNHRRMVDADECPCDSSVGCWWLPHDDIWLDASDISAHGQPTPLLDLWLGQRRGRDSDVESASIGRRRRG